MKIIKLPNGKIWRAGENLEIKGTLRIKGIDLAEGQDDILNAIAIATTGDEGGFACNEWVRMDEDLIAFKGQVRGSAASQSLVAWPSDVAEALATQYQLRPFEVKHALGALENEYGEETVIAVEGSSRALHCPIFPAECSYVRVTVGGFEVAYWTDSEWGESPSEVMGAILGAAKG